MTKEERREYARLYYHKNKDKILAENRERYAKDSAYREAKINNARCYNETNKEKIKERKSAYYETNKEKVKEYFGNYYNKNKYKLSNKRKIKYREEKIITQENV